MGDVVGGAAAPLQQGSWDDVEVGRAPACPNGIEAKVPATLSWKGLVVTAKDVKGKDRQILKGVDGYVDPRHLLAIMGPSGCGKTTLLDALAGRLAKNAQSTGEILVNGHKAQLNYGRAAYVTQDDVLIGTLTVRETLLFAAKLRLPLSMTSAEKEAVVDAVLSEMGLEAAKDTYIGNWHLRGVSGGQRRRVSIGCELVVANALIFLDEPTSGLDAASAFYVISAVRRLAEGCRTIIAVIHQPSSEVFALFDKLCLLSDGHVVYFGDAHRAADMFSAAGLPVPANRNPADHFLHVINRDFDDEATVDAQIAALRGAYGGSKVHAAVQARVEELTATPGATYEAGQGQPGWVYQTSVLTWRTFLNNLRNVSVFWLRLAMYVMLCLAVAFVYFQLGDSWKDVYSRAALLFFVVAFLTFMSVAAFPAFVEDMKIFLRERLNGYYGVSQFTVSNTLASLPFIFLIAVAASVCVYWIAGLLNTGGAVIYFILNLFLSLVVVESIMMAIAPVVPNFLMGIAAGAGLLGMYMIVCGFFQPLNSMPGPIFRYPLSYIAYHTYSFTGFMRNEFGADTKWGCPDASVDCTRTGTEVLAYYEIMDIDKWVCLAILAGMAAGYRVLFFATLKFREGRSG